MMARPPTPVRIDRALSVSPGVPPLSRTVPVRSSARNPTRADTVVKGMNVTTRVRRADGEAEDEQGLVAAIVGDGSPLLLFTGLCLALAGGFALFLSAVGQFLPHDIQFLGLSDDELCAVGECRVVRFMFHDRVAFGGALLAIGALYLWLVAFPLRRGEPWAWWTLAISGVAGFGSFLAYLGYGYLDSWHGAATLLLLPSFFVGMTRAFARLDRPRSLRAAFRPAVAVRWRSAFGLGRLLLLATAVGMIGGGLAVATIGMTSVFVPQDLAFMAMERHEFHAVSPRLVPLIAHDRAGYGGAVATTGIVLLFCAWCARPSRSLWQILCLTGIVGYATSIGVHPLVGYNDLVHLAPALFGALLFSGGLILTHRPMHASPT